MISLCGDVRTLFSRTAEQDRRPQEQSLGRDGRSLPQASFGRRVRRLCQHLPVYSKSRDCASRQRETSAADRLCHAVRPWAWWFSARRLRMAAAKARSWIHMLIFAATLTVTLYAVTDMEYPRLGLIRIEDFDHFLVDAHQQMQPRESVETIGSGR